MSRLCQYCESKPAERVITYPLFMFICLVCFMEYQRNVDELEWKPIKEYEKETN